jgi:hypothetical protein
MGTRRDLSQVGTDWRIRSIVRLMLTIWSAPLAGFGGVEQFEAGPLWIRPLSITVIRQLCYNQVSDCQSFDHLLNDQSTEILVRPDRQVSKLFDHRPKRPSHRALKSTCTGPFAASIPVGFVPNGITMKQTGVIDMWLLSPPTTARQTFTK